MVLMETQAAVQVYSACPKQTQKPPSNSQTSVSCTHQPALSIQVRNRGTNNPKSFVRAGSHSSEEQAEDALSACHVPAHANAPPLSLLRAADLPHIRADTLAGSPDSPSPRSHAAQRSQGSENHNLSWQNLLSLSPARSC